MRAIPPTVVTLLLLAAATEAPAQTPASSRAAPHVWVGVDGRPLPFQTHAEIVDFLRTADVVAVHTIPIGTTRPKRVVLQRDGVRAHAAFRYVEATHRRVRLDDGSYHQVLRDSAIAECAAYEIATMLGLDNVPPAIDRRIEGRDGTLQIWVENALREDERMEHGASSPDRMGWRRQTQAMYLFDILIGNVDRNQQNILIDPAWKIWFIDHTRAFQRSMELTMLQRIVTVEERLWHRLQALEEETIRERLGRFLAGPQIRAMFERRDELVTHLQGLIDQRGAGAVLYRRPVGGSTDAPEEPVVVARASFAVPLNDVAVPDSYDEIEATQDGLSLRTQMSVADVVAFFEARMPHKGWTLARPAPVESETITLIFEQDGRVATVHLQPSPGRQGAVVRITIES